MKLVEMQKYILFFRIRMTNIPDLPATTLVDTYYQQNYE